jgi:TPR repeat protein
LLLGLIFLDGKGDIDRNFVLAVKYFQDAASANTPSPMAEKAKSDAITCLRQMARGGVEDAKRSLRELRIGY